MKKNTIKNMVLVAIIAVLLFPHVSKAASSLQFYRDLIEELDIVQIYETSEIDCETLTNRNGSLVIETVIGVVLDDAGNGEILNFADEEYNYISYSKVDGAKEGNVIVTYLIYNPDTNYDDDILYRFDYIIDNCKY